MNVGSSVPSGTPYGHVVTWHQHIHTTNNSKYRYFALASFAERTTEEPTKTCSARLPRLLSFFVYIKKTTKTDQHLRQKITKKTTEPCLFSVHSTEEWASNRVSKVGWGVAVGVLYWMLLKTWLGSGLSQAINLPKVGDCVQLVVIPVSSRNTYPILNENEAAPGARVPP